MNSAATRLLGAEVHLASSLDPTAVDALVSGLLDGSPFRLAGVAADSGSVRCRFVAAEPDLALSWRNVAELQWRLAPHVEIVHVERVDVADAVLLLAPA